MREGRLDVADILDVLSEYEVLQMRANDIYGYTDSQDKRIMINRDASEPQKVRTIAHEVYHALAYMRGLKNTEKKTGEVERATYEYYKRLRHG